MRFLLQSIVFPQDPDPLLTPLYVDSPVDPVAAPAVPEMIARSSCRVPAGATLSLGSYFNAFPASYWKRWTGIRSIELAVELSGAGTVVVHRSDHAGVAQHVETRTATEAGILRFPLRLDGFDDGGWLWFDIVAGSAPVTMRGARWETDDEPERTGKASIGITTFNKPDYCAATLETLAGATDLRDLIDQVFVIDQGTRHVADEPGFATAAAGLGDTLKIISQPNLGGSGGFSRAMRETLDRPDSDFIQLLDDDVVIEPESLRRSIVFARYATVPTIVGGHMLDLLNRPRLHALAEVVDEVPFVWHPVHEDRMPHDFSVAGLRSTPMLHERQDSDFNGWWMCLIPMAVVRSVGLALPAFIKWDDAEYCLRAGEAGFPTVSVPGVALWHVSWEGKDDFLDWQAYFHARNRIVSALLHSTAPRGGTLLEHSRRMDLKHLISMQYYAVALRHRALRDILSGPGHMHPTLLTALPAARALAADFPETVLHSSEEPVRARRGRPGLGDAGAQPAPTGWRLGWFTLRTLVAHWFHIPRPENLAQPEVEIVKGDLQWWRLPTYDSAVVGAADGSGSRVYTRDRARYRALLRESFRLHRALRRQWPALAQQYRSAAPRLTSPDAWSADFDTRP